jgi:hypothetical protein
MAFQIIAAAVALVVGLVLGLFLTPKPQTGRLEPRDFEVPVSEEGRPIPWAFGTVTIGRPNVLWFGDIKTKAVKKKGGKK